MPFAGLTVDQTFNHSPPAGMRVAVHLPSRFKPAVPFALAVFLHGISVGKVPFEAHIQMAIAQIGEASTNSMLLSPRFGPNDDAGRFSEKEGFSTFIEELNSALPRLLREHQLTDVDADHIAAQATRTAPIVLVAYSGGWRPLNAILKGLLALDSEGELSQSTQCASRIVGIALLDSIYEKTGTSLYQKTSSGVLAWEKGRRAQTALLSICGSKTGLGASTVNLRLAKDLEVTGRVDTLSNWPEWISLAPGSVTFVKVSTRHQDIPRDGPPARPIAAFLSSLAIV
jgi:hypothetical protein